MMGAPDTGVGKKFGARLPPAATPAGFKTIDPESVKPRPLFKH